MALNPSAKKPVSVSLEGQVEIITDPRGVPHVFAASDLGAYFGLGYACARDRFCEMTLHRLLIYGRVSEFFGRKKTSNGDEFFAHDRKMRLAGYGRLAKLLHANMTSAGRALLKAYADGVNHYRATQAGTLHPYFSVGVKFKPLNGQLVQFPNEPWEPWDSIAIWLRISRLYSDAEGVTIAGNIEAFDAWVAGGAPIDPSGVPLKPVGMADDLFDGLFPPRVFDPGSAPVQDNASTFVKTVDKQLAKQWLDSLPQPASPLNPAWYCGSLFRGQYLRPFLRDAIDHDVSLLEALGIDGSSGGAFSHAWAVAGDGRGRAAALVGDPRIVVRRPSEFYEASMHGDTFEVRGVCIPGSPNFLVGSTKDVAWSPTKADLQQADLFELTFDAQNQKYQYGTNQVAPDVDEWEDIKIRGGAVDRVHYRVSKWGPILTEINGDSAIVKCRAGKQLAVCWMPRHKKFVRKEPTEGFLALYRVSKNDATSTNSIAEVFRERLGGWNQQDASGWTWPGVNLVFAASDGSVGYALTGAFPIRSSSSPWGGLIPQVGSNPAAAWRDIVSPEFMPWVCKLATTQSVQTVHSANQIPVDGTWYPIPLVSYGGDTIRSRRLRERLSPSNPIDDLAYVFAIHEDRVWNAGRDLVRLGIHLRDDPSQTPPLSQDARDVLQAIGSWHLPPPSGVNAECALHDSAGVDVALQSAYARWVGVLSFRRNQAGALVDTYGAGEGGLNLFLRKQIDAITNGDAVIPPLAAAYIDKALAYAKEVMLTDFLNEAALKDWFITKDSVMKKLKSWDPLECREAQDPDGTFDDDPPATIKDIGPLKAASDLTILSQRSALYSHRVTWTPNAEAEVLTPVHNQEQSTAGVDLDWKIDETATQGFYPSPLDKAGIQTPTSTTILHYASIAPR